MVISPPPLAPNLNDLYKLIASNNMKLRILPQWVECESSEARQLQVLTAAPSYQSYGVPTNNIDEKLCEVLVAAQYEAIAKLAVIRQLQTKQPLNVHLTLVGQKSFKNPPEVMKSAFAKVAAVVKNYPNIRIFIHAYSPEAQNIVLDNVTPDAFSLREMTKDEFMLGKMPG